MQAEHTQAPHRHEIELIAAPPEVMTWLASDQKSKLAYVWLGAVGALSCASVIYSATSGDREWWVLSALLGVILAAMIKRAVERTWQWRRVAQSGKIARYVGTIDVEYRRERGYHASRHYFLVLLTTQEFEIGHDLYEYLANLGRPTDANAALSGRPMERHTTENVTILFIDASGPMFEIRQADVGLVWRDEAYAAYLPWNSP